jgi:hypothetical protein
VCLEGGTDEGHHKERVKSAPGNKKRKRNQEAKHLVTTYLNTKIAFLQNLLIPVVVSLYHLW